MSERVYDPEVITRATLPPGEYRCASCGGEGSMFWAASIGDLPTVELCGMTGVVLCEDCPARWYGEDL